MLNNLPFKILYTLIILTYVSLVTLLPSLHFLPKTIVWFHDGQRLIEILLLILILVFQSLSHKSIPYKTNLSPQLSYALYLLLILSIISAALSVSPRHAFLEVSTFIALCFLSLFVANLYISSRDTFIRYFIYALWLAIGFYLVSFYSGYLAAFISKKPLQWPSPFTGFTNIRGFNQYQLWTIGLICLPLLNNSLKITNLTKTLAHVMITLWWTLVFYSASRGALIAWFLGLTLTVITFRSYAVPFMKLQFFYAIAGVLSYLFLFKILPALNHSVLVTASVIRDTMNDRLGLWNQAISLIKISPLFGVGPMHFAWNNETFAHPHNSILQFSSEWGLLASITLVVTFLYAAYYWLKKFNRNQLKSLSIGDGNLVIVLFFTVVTNFAYSMVDGVIVTPLSQVLMFTIVGIIIGQYCHQSESIMLSKHYFRNTLAVLTVVVLAWSSLPEILRAINGQEKGFSIGHTAIGPRFWREVQ